MSFISYKYLEEYCLIILFMLKTKIGVLKRHTRFVQWVANILIIVYFYTYFIEEPIL